MTDKSSPDRPKEEPDLARFLRDWTALWQRDLRAQAGDPESMADAMELWRAAMTVWSDALGMPPMRPAAARDRAGAPRAEAAPAASDPRDAALERLSRRVDELEARLAQSETVRRRRS